MYIYPINYNTGNMSAVIEDVEIINNTIVGNTIDVADNNDIVKNGDNKKEKGKSTGRPKKAEKENIGPTQRDLRAYIMEHNLQKEFSDYHGKGYSKADKQSLIKFIEAHKLELSLNKSNQPSEQVNDQPSDQPGAQPNAQVEEDEIKNIPMFNNVNNSQPVKEEEQNFKLNPTQYKIKQYVQEFPHKLKLITSRPTYNKEFAQVKEQYIDAQTGEEYKCPLLLEIEKEIGRVNALSFIANKSVTVIEWIEDFCDAVRRHKSVSEGGKIPDFVKNTIGNLRLNGWHKVLAEDPSFHDIIKELLIKYGGDIESILSYLSVETRLAMILLGSAYFVHKNNVRYEEEIKNKQSKPIPAGYKNL